MRHILGLICIAMFVTPCGYGAGTNPFESAADSNSATTDVISVNDWNTSENTLGYAPRLPDTIRFVMESGMDLNGRFTTEFDTNLGSSIFETGTVYVILSTYAEGLTSENAGYIILTSQDPTQFMNAQNSTHEGEIDQYEESGGFNLDRNLP